MIRVRWELEEAVALMNLYFRYGATLGVPNDDLLKLSQIYRNRANILGLNVDDKFRNLSGMKMQLGCIPLPNYLCRGQRHPTDRPSPHTGKAPAAPRRWHPGAPLPD